MPEHFNNQGTDFHSLLASDAAAAAQGDPAIPSNLNFEALAQRYPDAVSKIYPRTATDYLIDLITPFLVFLMIFTIVWFLLDVRYVFTEVQNTELRIFGICMVMGVVALNRLIARDGSEESFLYIAGLFAVVVIYTYLSTTVYGMGSVARGFLNNPAAAAFLNFGIVAFLWWLANRLTHECCVDTNPHAGNIGLLTGVARDFRARSQATVEKPSEKKPFFVRRPKGHVLEMMEIEPYDPTDWKPPEPAAALQSQAPMAERPSARHPGMSVFYFSVPVMLAFALGLPVLIQGGEPMVLAGHLYVAVYTFCALMLLLLSSLASLREYFRMRHVFFPALIGWWWIALGLAMVLVVLVGAASLPMPAMPGAAAIQEHEVDFWTRGSTFKLTSPAADAAVRMQQYRVVDKLQTGVFIFLGVIALFSALRGLGELGAWFGRNRHRFPKPLVRFFENLDAFLERVLKLPELPSFKRRRRISAALALSTKHHNPLEGQGEGSRQDIAMAVARSYEALCALAEDVGKPKPKDMTPFEFLRVLPEELHGLRDEARELISLYVKFEYSNEAPDKRVLDRLRKFWMAYEKVRGGLIK